MQNHNNQKRYKILIVAPSWVGDLVITQALFKLLKATLYNNNTPHLTILANAWTLDILKRMPEVDDIIENPFKHKELAIIKRIQFGYQLRKYNFNQAIIIPNSFKAVIVPFVAKIPMRTGFVGEMRYGLLNNIYRLHKQSLPQMIDRVCALANYGKKAINPPYPQLIVDSSNQQQLIKKFKINSNKSIIAFCPGAEYGPSKQWLSQNFAKLANLLLLKNYIILILGSSNDLTTANEIITLAQINPSLLINLCGLTSLSDTVDLLALANYTITNDSGLMHIASSVGSHIIAIYGSSSPAFTPPLTTKKNINYKHLACSPCFLRTCKYGHYNCLRFITAEHINNLIPIP